MNDTFDQKSSEQGNCDNQNTMGQNNCSNQCMAAVQNLTNCLLWEINSLRQEIKKPRRVIRLVFSIILFFYAFTIFIAVLGIGLSGDYEDPILTSENTIEFTATIERIQSIPYRIQFAEHDAIFFISDTRSIVDMSGLNGLAVGNTVIFRIRKDDLVNIDKLSGSINFVALKGSTDIITLSSTNEYGTYDTTVPLIIFAIVGTFFLVPAILLLVSYIRRNPKRIKKTDVNKFI